MNSPASSSDNTINIKAEFESPLTNECLRNRVDIKVETDSEYEEESLVYQPPPISAYIPMQIDPLKDEPLGFDIKSESDDQDDNHFLGCEGEFSYDKMSPKSNEESKDLAKKVDLQEIINQNLSPVSTVSHDNLKYEILKGAEILSTGAIKLRKKKRYKTNKKYVFLKFHCSICDKVFADGNDLSNHYDFSHPSNISSIKKNSLEKNSLIKKRQNVQRCLKCKGTFLSKSDFVNHIDDVGMCKFLNCKICGMIYADIDRLQIHLKRKHDILEKDFKYKCKHCDLEYDKQISLYKHVARKHSEVSPSLGDINKNRAQDGIKNIVCSKCKSHFISESFYKSHLDDNNMCKLLNCSICGMIYTNTSNLYIHMKRKHNIVKGDFKFCCQYCGLEFMKKTTLQSHINVIHMNRPNKPTLYKCITCNAEFNLRNSLQKHIKRKHDAKSTTDLTDVHICHYCGEMCETHLKLSDHLDIFHNNIPKNEQLKTSVTVMVPDESSCHDENKHTDITQLSTPNDFNLKYKCRACSQKCKDLKALRSHVTRYHCSLNILGKKNPLEKFTCEYCGVIMSRHSLNKHIQRKHAQENASGQFKNLNDKKHKCIYCDYRSDAKGNIKIHERIHTKEKPYICGIDNCQHRAAHSTSIKLHRLTHDPTKNMLYCDRCNFKTINKYFFKMHQKDHQTGERRTHACELCSYKTPFLSSYNHHKLTHTNDKIFQCGLCFFSTKYLASLRKHEKSKHGLNCSVDPANELIQLDNNVTNWQEWTGNQSTQQL